MGDWALRADIPPSPPPAVCADRQALIKPLPDPGLRTTVCQSWRWGGCCTQDAIETLEREDLEPRGLPATCWRTYEARMCSIACDPDARTWDWVDIKTPVLCEDFCLEYYSNCLADGANARYAQWTNATEWCAHQATQGIIGNGGCLSVAESPPPPPSPPPEGGDDDSSGGDEPPLALA